MRTTQEVPQGGRADPAAVGRTLTEMLLQGRDSLPAAPNGRPLAPSSSYVAQVRKEMANERSREFQRIWAVCQCDLKDGVPLPLVTAALRQMLTLLDVEAVAQEADRRTPCVRVLGKAWRRETRYQGDYDVAQVWAVEEPENPVALSNALHFSARYTVAQAAFDRIVSGLLHRVRHAAPTDGLRIVR
jgi:hypothetical protein